MSRIACLALATLISMGACVAEDEFVPSDNEEQADISETVEFRVPDVPTSIEIGPESTTVTNNQSIAYGHCNPAETGDDGVIRIDCPAKWTEVAWLHVSLEQSRELMAQGYTALDVQLAVDSSTREGDSLRISAHEVNETGAKRKLLSEPNVSDGESIEIPLGDTAFDVYLARGVNSIRTWQTGTIEFTVTTAAL
ncbi:MAG: hypothetical protein GY811_20460 [Myxococcales bacterium]|nr:hypothetical protein [Myxococcales bacterium]